MIAQDWNEPFAPYAERLHAAAGPDHHVVSALGAWLLLALCAPLADTGARAELAEVLGADPLEAAQFAAELLSQPHPLAAAGAGLWVAPAVTTPAMERWRDGLPPGVTTGDIPTQEAIDAWANERTLGLIDRFPIQMDPDLVCLLATALATKVSWDVPFELVDAAALAPSPWAASLNRVLQSPVGSVRFSGGIPPAWRNHRVPTGTDTPTPADASTVVTPVAISRQNSRCTARDGSGRPGERIGGRNARSAAHCRLESTGASGESFLPRPIAHLHHRDVATTG